MGVTNSVITSNDIGIHAYNGANTQVTSNIIVDNDTGIYCYNNGSTDSSYNTYFENTTHRAAAYYCTVTTSNDKDSIDPLLNRDYTLQTGSPAIDAGSPVPAEGDPDGSRNDQGIYGGPGAAAFTYPNLPIVTNLFITPSGVESGGTFSIQATGQAQ